MTAQLLDSMNDASPWAALASDGVTASTELTITPDPRSAGWGADKVSARISASAAATGHRLQRSLPATDLSDFSELRLSVEVDSAHGAEFLLELRLASAAMGFDDPANTWHRLVPGGSPRGWTVLAISLDDLPAGVANAVTGIRFRCVAGPFVIHLDDVVAVRPRPLADADAALLAMLAGVQAGGGRAGAAIRTPGQLVPTPPAIDIEQFDIRYAASRVIDRPVRRDFTVDGYRECVAGTPFDVDYAVRPIANDRASQAQLLEAVLTRVPANGELLIDGVGAPIELVSPPGSDRIGGAIGESPVLVYRVGVRTAAVVRPRVIKVDRIEIGGGLLEMSA